MNSIYVLLKARGIEPVVKMGSLKFKMEEGRWLLYARAAIQKTSPPIPSLVLLAAAASFLAFKHIHRSDGRRISLADLTFYFTNATVG